MDSDPTFISRLFIAETKMSVILYKILIHYVPKNSFKKNGTFLYFSCTAVFSKDVSFLDSEPVYKLVKKFCLFYNIVIQENVHAFGCMAYNTRRCPPYA